MNKGIKPREYQKECLAAIDKTIARGEKRALVVMASGLGKTYTAAFAVEKFFTDKPFGHVLILCHSEPILRQSKKEFKDYFGEEFSYGMYVGCDKTTRPTNFLFATFQTMKENRKNFQKDEFDYIIVDEAHHSKARTYFPTIRYFQSEFLLGLTATPDRLDGQKIEEFYGEPVYELGFVEATKRGLIAECDYRLVLDDLSQERLDEYLASNEKLSIKQLNRTLFIKKRDEEIVRLIGGYSAGVKNPKTMIFCRTITHARKIAQLMGDNAALVHKKNSDSANDRALRAFKSGEINTIISVDMLNEGVDIPDANVIVFLRNTVSPAVFYQQLGRGTRLAKGKKKVLVLDFVGNCERIKAILELKQEIDDFKLQIPVTEYSPHGAGEADSREKFTLNTATPEFQSRIIDIITLLETVRSRKEWTCEECIAAIQQLADRLGKTILSYTDYANSDIEMPVYATLQNRFGSFEAAIVAAGLQYERLSNERGRFDLEDELFAMARAYVSKLGREFLTVKNIEDNPEFPSWSTLSRQYGTIGNFNYLAGIASKKPVSRSRKKCPESRLVFDSKENIKLALSRKIEELGGSIPTTAQLEADETMPTKSQIRKFYAKYGDVYQDVGLDVGDLKKRQKYTDQEIRTEAHRIYHKLGHAPSRTEWNRYTTTCCYSTVTNRYGNYRDAIAELLSSSHN